MNDDTAASLQMEYDEAVAIDGADSFDAWVCEQEARQYFNPTENQE
jgi:hypothetical protein